MTPRRRRFRTPLARAQFRARIGASLGCKRAAAKALKAEMERALREEVELRRAEYEAAVRQSMGRDAA